MKQYTTKAMIDRLDRECGRLWRRIILLRAGGKCEICGISKPKRSGEVLWIQACHIASKSYGLIRWHPRNGVAGCLDCHDHKVIMTWLARTDPDRYEWILEQKRRQAVPGDIDLEKTVTELRDMAFAC